MRDCNIKEKKLEINNHQQLIFLLIGLFLCSFLIYSFYSYNATKNKTYIPKKEFSKKYIYTTKKEFKTNKFLEVPTINLEGEKFEKINESIINRYEKKSIEKDFDYEYEFNQSKDILALKITYIYSIDENIKYDFETYNIDLTTGKILTNSEILKRYHLTSKQVNDFLNIKFEMMYQDIITQKYYTKEECNYDCFLKNRKISNQYLNGVSYYIDNNSLTLFKYFDTTKSDSDRDYFNDQTYQFIVKE